VGITPANEKQQQDWKCEPKETVCFVQPETSTVGKSGSLRKDDQHSAQLRATED
jgi:hypothetical protein